MFWFGKRKTETTQETPRTSADLYKEVLSKLSDNVFCKATKTDPSIAGNCLESWYKEYKVNEWVTDNKIVNPDGNNGMSFVPISKALYIIGYGDTYTEFDFSDERLKELPDNAEITFIGGMFSEIKATDLFVKKQMPLSDINTHLYLIKNTDISNLTGFLYTLNSPILSPIIHLEKLGYSDAAEFWRNVLRYIKKTNQFLETAIKLQDKPQQFMSAKSLQQSILR